MGITKSLVLMVTCVALSACGGGSSAPNLPPTFSGSTSLSVIEGKEAVAALVFSDPEGRAVSQSITGGVDQARFQLTTAGALSFAVPSDFESPSDVDANNSYQISITATDGVNEVSKAITVNVVNALEGRVGYPPISGSTVFVDTDGDFILGADERSTLSDAQGFFAIEDTDATCSALEGCDTLLVARGGTDITTGSNLGDLLLYGTSLANQDFSLSPISTLLMQSADQSGLLEALGIDLSADELAAIDPWQDSSATGEALLRLNQQVVALLQSAKSMVANNVNVTPEDLTVAFVASIASYSETHFLQQGLALDLTDGVTIKAVLVNTLSALTLDNPISDAEFDAVSEALAQLNVVLGDDLLDLVSDVAAEIIRRAQVDLREAITQLVTQVIVLGEFEGLVAPKALYADIPLLDSLPDLDDDGVADIVDEDDDADGVNDARDDFPRDETETTDTDGDGIGNNADTDDDGDGVLDGRDPHPLDATLTPPTAHFTANRLSGDVPLEVSFDASESIAGYLDDSITLYAWTFGDGGQANGPLAEHVFASAGPYAVELTLTNSDNFTHTASLSITAIANTNRYTVSGAVSVTESLAVDSDVNDWSSAPVSNNSIAAAQTIYNPTTLSGYVNAPGDGPLGHSKVLGDVDDYYEINALGGEIINLNMSNPSKTDLDLEVFDSNGNYVEGSYGVTRFESIKLPMAPGVYYLSIYVYDNGGSTYLLTVGQDNSLLSTGWSTADDFAIGDVIFKERAGAQFKTASYMAQQKRPLSFSRAGASGPTLYRYGKSIAQFSSRASAFKSTVVSSEKRLKADTLLAVKQIAKQGSVEYAEPNYRHRRQVTQPNDERYSVQWHYPKIKLGQAWDISTGSSDIKVAVIDTGIFEAHPDLASRMSDDGYDFINDVNNAGDGDGIDANGSDPGDGRDNVLCTDSPDSTSSFHGTHVAGTIGAATNNSLGVSGVTWATQIMNLRVLGCEGGYDFDIANAIRYAAGLDNQSGVIVADPADIANMSLGGGSSSNTMANAIADARDAGLIIIAAAGNSSSSSASYPAAYEGVVSVSATSMADSLANYSNYGSWVDVAAPGGQDGDLDGDGYQDLVLSTLARIEGGIIEPSFGGYQGTSMAAPHVAGVVALMKGIHPSLSPADLDAVIVSGNMTADLGAAGRDDNYGYGRIDALKTVGFANQLASGAPIPVTPILSFSNTYLNFGRLTQQVTVNVYNSGNGSLGVTSVAVSESRISVAAPASDDGLGNYAVSVDRSGLISGVYRGSVTFTSSVGERVVSVLYQVGSSGVTDEGDAGAVSILLYDVAAGETASFETVVSPINGEYQYRFSGPAGVYYVIAGSDLDNDGYICNPGEACGVYPLPDSPITLILNQNLSGVDFGVNFIIPSDAAGAASAVLKKPISRTKAPPQKGSF